MAKAKTKKVTPPKPPAKPAVKPPKKPSAKKPTAKEVEDLLGGAPAAPAAAATQPPPATVVADDDLLAAPKTTMAPIGSGALAYKEDAKAKPVKLAKCRHSAGGEVHLYDRTKGAPPFKLDKSAPQQGDPAWRWLLMHVPSGLFKLMEQKRPARRVMSAAAKAAVPELTPAGAVQVAQQRAAPPAPGAAAGAAPQTTAKPAPAAVPDEDFNKKSEGPHPVPSVWVREGSRYGLLVYVGRTRAKIVTAQSGTVAVEKIRTEDLATEAEREQLRAALQAAAKKGKDGESEAAKLTKRLEDMWLRPAATHTPEHYAALMVKSQLDKSPAARAYLDRILGQMDDLLLPGGGDAAAEEDLLG